MILKHLFHAAAGCRKKPAKPMSVTRLFLPSCLVILLSMACFMSASWAWFTLNESCNVTTVQSGHVTGKDFSVTTITQTVEVTKYEWASEGVGGYDTLPADVTETPVETTSNPAITTNEDGSWTFVAAANQKHLVSLTLDGNVAGHCIVTLQEAPAESAQSPNPVILKILPDEDKNVKFYLLHEKEYTVTVSVTWGTPSEPSSYATAGNEEIPVYGNATEQPVEHITTVYVQQNTSPALQSEGSESNNENKTETGNGDNDNVNDTGE